ncbi:general secretion pathway gspg-related protein [Candidatus Moduliflexus flocculans]|uniref:General secretion pathway gspg-related protein n=1 Tax=Candidatus Moduliflexus flocculans TaxID=1499966 RepID=A0A081BN77_9BACT|nr:general secretion pathway gspg-related protein [Candidatus Moduliflexus flocculans]
MYVQRRGFTLIELLVVIAIIGILAAIAAPILFSVVQRAKFSATLTDMKSIIKALEMYNIDFNHYPIVTNFTDWGTVVKSGVNVYYRGAEKDSWGMPFRYITDTDGQHFMIKSFGANKVHNNKSGSLTSPADWVDDACAGIDVEQDYRAVIKNGCDIVYLNGLIAIK